MASIVATGEESRERLREKGVTPGKIKTGSVSRSSSGTRTTRSASGEVEKVEEPVKVDGDRMIKTTTYQKESVKGAPGTPGDLPQTETLYDPSGSLFVF